MAAFRRGKLFVTPWMQCRHRGKINIKNPKPGPFQRQILAAITQPVMQEDLYNPALHCTKMEEKTSSLPEEEVNLYEQFLVRQCKQIFENYRMVMVCQPSPLKGKDLHALRNKFLSGGMRLVYDFPDTVIRQALVDTHLQNMEGLFIGHERLIVSKEDNIRKLVKLARRSREFVLLGGALDDRMYSYADLQHYATLPDLHSLQGQTVSILNTALSKTHGLLSHHQVALTRSLDSLAAPQSSQISDKES